MPKFSIIVPVYNVAPYLRECLDSVLAQTFTDWECLCVDDGSTDESGAILDEYATKDSRFKVIHQKNQGVAVARQVALDHIRGDWMIAIDPDDWVEPSNLEDLYKAVVNTDLDMVWCDYYYDKDGSSRVVSTRGENNSESHLEDLLKSKIMGSLWNHLLSRDFILKNSIKFPPKGCDVAEDLYFLCSFLVHKPTIKWLDFANYHYVYRQNSLSNHVVREVSFSVFVKTINELCELLKDSVDFKLLACKKQYIKFDLYDKKQISDAFFLSVFPDTKDLSELKVKPWHRFFFGISVRGFRRYVLFLLLLFRKLRRN